VLSLTNLSDAAKASHATGSDTRWRSFPLCTQPDLQGLESLGARARRDTVPLARSATAPLSQEQCIQAQPNRPVTAPRSWGGFFRSSDSRPYAGERASRPRRVLAHTRRQGDNDGMASDDSEAPSSLRLAFMPLLDGARPSRTLGWVSPVAPVVTQAAAGAGHWASGRRQRALAEWAGAAGFGRPWRLVRGVHSERRH
jgi:hypothetical protein